MSLIHEIDYGTPASKSEKLVTLTIDGREVTVPEGTSIMRAAMDAGIEVPKLCASDMMDAFGSCRLCLVEIKGRAGVRMLVFAAITMLWFRVRLAWWEAIVLSLACLLLFRPDLFMDRIAPEFVPMPPAKLYDVARDLPANGRLVVVIGGTTIEGDEVRKTVAVRLGPAGDDGYRMPGYPWLPAIFVVVAFAVVLSTVVAAPGRSAVGAGLPLAGVPVYYCFRR